MNASEDVCWHEWLLIATRPSGIPGPKSTEKQEVKWCWQCGSLCLKNQDGRQNITKPGVYDDMQDQDRAKLLLYVSMFACNQQTPG